MSGGVVLPCPRRIETWRSCSVLCLKRVIQIYKWVILSLIRYFISLIVMLITTTSCRIVLMIIFHMQDSPLLILSACCLSDFDEEQGFNSKAWWSDCCLAPGNGQLLLLFGLSCSSHFLLMWSSHDIWNISCAFWALGKMLIVRRSFCTSYSTVVLKTWVYESLKMTRLFFYRKDMLLADLMYNLMQSRPIVL